MPSQRYYVCGVNGTGTLANPFRSALQDLVNGFLPLTGASNAAPIVITAVTHGLQTGDTVFIRNVQGNTAANGSRTITVIDPSTFSLDGSSGNGAYVSGTGTYRQDLVRLVQTLTSGAGQAFCQANVTNHARLSGTVGVGLLPAATLDTLWGNIGTLAQRAAILSDLTVRGYSVGSVTDATPYQTILGILGQRHESSFNINNFSAG